eukprot:364660-Chlamydomonas_euryale.AAC.2
MLGCRTRRTPRSGKCLAHAWCVAAGGASAKAHRAQPLTGSFAQPCLPHYKTEAAHPAHCTRCNRGPANLPHGAMPTCQPAPWGHAPRCPSASRPSPPSD